MQAESEIVRLPARDAAPPDFRLFFEDQHRSLSKALYLVTGDRAEADDLMQETFLKFWERWTGIASGSDERDPRPGIGS
jgi:DNA-directed RNA polymerase specialized sigma24 family protein